MKRISVLLLIVVMFSSCDPDIVGEGVTLPVMEFNLKVKPDTAYIRLGDTVTLSGSVPSLLNNGVKIEDGEAEIALFYGYTSQTPVTTFGFSTPKEGDDLSYIINKGRVNIVEGTINRIYALPYGDSIQVEIDFVPLKKGTYTFYVQSMFYEGSKGKTRTQPIFAMPNHHFDELWELGDDYSYEKQYLFAVTD